MKKLFLGLMVVLSVQARADKDQQITPFSLRFGSELSQGVNQFFSGFSIHSALTLAHLFSDGLAEEQLGQFLGYPKELSKKDIASGYASLLRDLKGDEKVIPMMRSHMSQLPVYWKQNNKVIFEVANRILMSEKKQIDGQTQELAQIMGAQWDTVDFARPEVVTDVNNWVSEKTHGKITSIVKKFHPKLNAVLLNAVYFKGAWMRAFKKATPGKFTTLENESVDASLMRSTQMAGFHEDGDKQILELGYRGPKLESNQSRFSLVVVLPKSAEKFTEIEQNLASSLSTPLSVQNVEITLPKFKQVQTYLLEKQLEKHIPQAFVELSRQSQMAISQVIHKSFVEIDEKGTEAAAVTGITLRATCVVMKPKYPAFVADHPFFYVIRDNLTDTILFQGSLVNPN